MYAFEYVKPGSLTEVSAFLKANPEARPLAGGMTLIPTMKARLAQVSQGALPVRDPSINDRIAQAEAAGDWNTYDRLQAQKVEAARTPFELPGLTQATQLLTSVTKDGDRSIDIYVDLRCGRCPARSGRSACVEGWREANREAPALPGRFRPRRPFSE